MVNLILKECMSRGILLDKEVFGMLSDLGEEVALEVVDILGGLGVRVVTRKIFDEYPDKFGKYFGAVEVVKSDGVKVLSDVKFKSGKVEVGDFVRHFRSRFEALKEILVEKNFDNLSSIRRIGVNSGVYTIVAMVTSRRITKNRNLLLEVEDLTGRGVVLVNRENQGLFDEASNLMLDDVVAFRVSGSSRMLFANGIIFPDSKLGVERHGDRDEYIAFSGDLHIGSKMFLERNLMKFVSWLNGEVGDERQRAIAMKVGYLILTGDLVDGVGVYSGQDKFLNIKSCREQYRKVAEILGKIRRDVQIVICAGQHDAVWVGEPQGVVSKKWASGLYGMKNVSLVSNPALIEVDGFKILMYHGASINRIKDLVSGSWELGTGGPTRVVREMLKRRHLAPTHGVMDYVPREKDLMVIGDVPDIIATGDQHRAEVDSYNNILMVASSCWQSITPFGKKIGNVPEPCRVPLFNLKTREVKIVDFSDEEIKWESGEDLVCKLGAVKDED